MTDRRLRAGFIKLAASLHCIALLWFGRISFAKADNGNDIDNRSRTHFDRGMELKEKQDNCAEAVVEFKAAHDLAPFKPRPIYELAQCEQRLLRTSDAWNHYHEALDKAHAQGKKDTESLARAGIESLKSHLSKITIKIKHDFLVDGLAVSIDEAQLPINGNVVSKVANPGKHRVTAKAPNRTAFVADVDLKVGATEVVEVYETRLATYRILNDEHVKNVVIRIDGKVMQTILKDPAWVSPGEHTVTASAPGYFDKTWHEVFLERESRTKALSLESNGIAFGPSFTIPVMFYFGSTPGTSLKSLPLQSVIFSSIGFESGLVHTGVGTRTSAMAQIGLSAMPVLTLSIFSPIMVNFSHVWSIEKECSKNCYHVGPFGQISNLAMFAPLLGDDGKKIGALLLAGAGIELQDVASESIYYVARVGYHHCLAEAGHVVGVGRNMGGAILSFGFLSF